MSYWDELAEIVKVSPGHYQPRRQLSRWDMTWKRTMAYYAKLLKPKPPEQEDENGAS